MPINRIPKVKSVSGKIGDVVLTSSDVGLGNVNNTSDVNKPIPASVQAALNAKQDILTAGSGISIVGNTITSTSSGVTMDQVNAAIDNKIAAINFNPTPVNDTANGTEDTTISGNVLTNDTTTVGSLYVTQYRVYSISAPSGTIYTAGVSSTTNPLGTFIMNSNGSWTLNPRANGNGSFTINYWVSNGISNPVMANLVINLTAVNDAPIVADDSGSSTTDTPVTIFPLGNDYDVEGNSITITKINNTNVTSGQSVNVTNAVATLNANSSITITPSAGYTGNVQFTYTVSDGSLNTTGNISVTFSASVQGGGTNNYLTGTTNLIPYNFAANVPAKNQTKVEPTTGVTVKRITDVTQDFPSLKALYNAYSRYPNENYTGEYVLAFGSNSTSCLVVSIANNTITASLAYDNTGLATHSVGAYHEVRWHYTSSHPYRVYYVRNQEFWMIDDVRSQSTTRTLIKDFSTLIDWTGTPAGAQRQIYNDQEGNSSLDSDHWAWMASYYDTTTGRWTVRAFVHYQVSTDTTHIMYPSNLTGFSRIPANESSRAAFRYKPNMVEVAPDGSGIVIHHMRAYAGNQDEYIGTIFEAPYFFPIDFNPSTLTPFRLGAEASHSGWSSVNGNWYFIHQDTRRDKWCGVPIFGSTKGYGNEGNIDVNLNLNPAVIDFHSDGGIYPGMHFGVCTGAADGWTLVSTYSTSTVANNALANHLYMMQIKPEAQTIKWMVSPSFNQFPAADKQDYNEAPASINLTGTKIYTCGDWNGNTGSYISDAGVLTHYVDLFQVPLPDNWQNHFVPAAPVNLTVPTWTGTQSQGQVLTYTPGTWSGYPTPTITRNWQRDSVDIAGATGTTYTLQAADVGHIIRVREQAVNASGTVNAYSSGTGSIVAIPIPASLTIPTLTGTYQQGYTLSIGNGTWTNSPTSITHDILRDGATVVATNVGNSYTIVAGDVGHTLSVRENATNSYGTANVLSNPTPTITLNQGTISRISSVVSVDPGGSFESSRATPSFDAVAGNLIVVNVVYSQTGGNTITSVSDTAGNTYTAGTTGSTVNASTNTVTQQWWCLSSAAKTGNIITVTQSGGTGGMSGTLDVVAVQYQSSTGTWSRTTGVVGGTDYVAMPMTTSAFNMAANSVAVASIGSYYNNTLPISTYGDTLVTTQQSSGWIIDRISGSALTNQTIKTMDSQGGGYSRLCYSVGVFTAA